MGINKTTPYATLDINGKLKTTSFQLPDPAPDGGQENIDGCILQSRDRYGNAAWIPQSSIDDGDWTKDGCNVYRLGGKVGIGTSNPNSELEVIGTVSANNFDGDGSLLTNVPGDNLGDHIMDLTLETNGNWINGDGGQDEGVYIDDYGKVGIGTNDPKGLLSLYKNVSGENLGISFQNGQSSRYWIGYNEYDDIFYFGAINGQSAPASGSINVTHNGNVGIGTADIQTSGYKLTVAGNIKAQEIKIQHPDQWYDFVFDDTYKLPQLSELESFVKQNKHLPDVPSEAEVMEQGINLGEMNGILLKKIEELTLYVIEQQKEIDKLKEAVQR